MTDAAAVADHGAVYQPSAKDIRMVIAASSAGTIFEWYDFFIYGTCLLYTSPSPRDKRQSRMPSSA